MGIGRTAARLLLDEARSRPFRGSLLQLARASVYFGEAELREWAGCHGVALTPGVPIELSHDPELAFQGCLSDRTFFRLLGFDEVWSADLSPWEGADLLFDLNLPAPEALHGRFDAVLEAGTIQHVFHLPNVLANLHRLLRPGGRVIHAMTTSTNHIDHGFYMFSPTLFNDWYRANGWRLECQRFFEFLPVWYRGRLHTPPCRVYDYAPGCLDHLSYGGFGSRQVALFVVATKTAEATADRIPQQGYFARFWPRAEKGLGFPDGADPGPLRRRWVAVRDRLFERAPLLARTYIALRQVQAWLRRGSFRRLPPVVARY